MSTVHAQHSKPVILCVDDEKVVLDSLTSQLNYHLGDEFEVEVAQSGDEALELFEELVGEGSDIALVISDQLMPGLKGDELLIKLHHMRPETLKILLTGQASTEAVGRAINEAKLYRFISKPWDKNDLLLTIEEAVNSYRKSLQIDLKNKLTTGIYEAGQHLNKVTQLGPLCTNIARLLVENTGAERCAVALMQDDKRGIAYTLDAFGHTEEKPFRMDQANTGMPVVVLNQAASLGQMLVVPNAQAAPWDTDPYIVKYRPGSLCCTPLVHDGEMLGLLYLERQSEQNYFTAERAEFVNLFAMQSAVSIANARLLESLEQKVAERTHEVTRQKEIIEEKNRDIMDSILYASRIQQAILPEADLLQRHFADFLLMYRPKDIISGDFYYLQERSGCVVMAAVDCTGHGVPGAMLATLGYNLLDQLVLQHPDCDPGCLLYNMDARLKERLRKDGDAPVAQSMDGMDLALLDFNPQSLRLQFAGANRNLLVQRGEELLTYKGDRWPLGGSLLHTGEHHYVTQEVQLQAGDRCFFFTDGIVDQFDKANEQKYGIRRLQDFLQKNRQTSLSLLEHLLDMEMQTWRGQQVQTDDILMMGFAV